MSNNNLSADIYGTSEFVNALKKKFTPDVPEDTLMLGIFGYLGEVFSNTIQNTIVMASEFSNESIPTKAKFEKNIIAHALGLGATDINAVPSQMDVLLTFVEDDIINWAGAKDADGNELPWTFIFDKDTPIYIGDYCFHVDYDIEIKKIQLYHGGMLNKFNYTAKYLIDVDNPVSDVTNPYLTAPVKMNVNGMNVLFTKCTLRQVSRTTIHKKILSDNSISAKTATFEFEGQLASFTVDVEEGDIVTHLVPIYEGLDVDGLKYPYIYFTYLDTNTIRIKFDRNSYMPRLNSNVYIKLQITEGEGGNFTYAPSTYPSFSFDSDKYGYSSIGCEIRPITGECVNGINRKSIEELKRFIPKEALSRGSITSLTDLKNYFNAIDNDSSAVYIYKKRDNALERLYYMYIIMRDKLNNIIPTNTIDIQVRSNSLKTDDGTKLVLVKNMHIGLNNGDEYATIVQKGSFTPPDFSYNTPFNVVVNKNPLYAMYFLPAVDTKKFLEFYYINDNSIYQYIATSIKLYRAYMHNDTYSMTISVEQNVDVTSDMLHFDNSGNVIDADIRCIAVFYNDADAPFRWSEGSFISCDTKANIFTFKFSMGIEDFINEENKVRVETGIYDPGTTTESYGYFSSNTKCIIHILAKQNEKCGTGGLENIVPNLMPDEGDEDQRAYSLCNSYNVLGGIDLFYDYSDIVNSTVLLGLEGNDGLYGDGDETGGSDDGSGDDSGSDDGTTTVSEDDIDTIATGSGGVSSDTGETGSLIIGGPGGSSVSIPINASYLTIKSVPVVKYGYLGTEEEVSTFCNELVRRKVYIEELVDILEDLFGMDFKFFNTYGPSKLFTTDNASATLNAVNIRLTFRIKLKPNHDTNIINDIIADIKAYIENINAIKSIHMTNLIAEITTKYRDYVEYFEFADMNGYGPTVQHIYAMDMPDELTVPEFLNIETDSSGTPRIQIILE